MKLFLFSVFTFLFVNSIFAQDLTLTPGPCSCEYKEKDINENFDTNADIFIRCEGTSCSSSSSDIVLKDNIINITANGTYIVEGTLNGQLRVSLTKNDFIHLVLNSVTISSSDGPAIYVTEADKVTITLLGESTLKDSSTYSDVVEEEPDACLFVDSDLSINGSGSLTVSGNYGDAIRCKKDLKIISGNINVPNAVQRGIKAKNSICVKDGTLDINSSNTGIKVTRDDDANKGFIVFDGGNTVISTGKDGIHAETHLTIRGGYIDVKKSVEGIEGQMIDILGGEVHVLASDDGINASKITNSTETNNGGPGGDMTATGTDGSVYINIVGGKTYVTVDGNDTDGIDSNGVLYIGGEAEVYASISGGDIYGNMAALDAEGTNAITDGATVVVTSSSMGMSMGGPGNMNNKTKRQGPNNMGKPGDMGGMGGMGGMSEEGSIYQPYIKTSVDSQNANTPITIKDSNNNVIATYTPSVSYSSLLISSPSMKAGETYTIVTGESTITANASEPMEGSVDSPSVSSPNDTSKVGNSTSGGIHIQPKCVTFLILFISILYLL